MNVLFVMLDDGGSELFSIYGRGGGGAYTYPSTPWLTALAEGGTVQGVTYAGGVRYDRHYAEALCSPTRVSFLTGLYPLRHGVGDIVRNDDNGVTSQVAMSEGAYTIADALKAYDNRACAMFGKAHIANTNNGRADFPRRIGFDLAAIQLFNTSNAELHTVNGETFREGFYAWPQAVQGADEITQRTYSTTALVNQAYRWIKDRGTDPWFCYLPLYAVHAPFVNRTNLTPNTINTPSTALYDAVTWDKAADANQTTDEQIMHAFRAGWEAADTELGRLFARLNELPGDVLANTLVIFTTDNGSPTDTLSLETHPTLGPYPSGHAKDSPYEPGICVPLVMAGAGFTGAPRSHPRMTNVVDLFPTIYQIVTGELPPNASDLDGTSFSYTYTATSDIGARPFSYSEWFQPNGAATYAARTATEWAVVGGDVAAGGTKGDGRYKLLLNGVSGLREFYDLIPSPGVFNVMEDDNLMPSGDPSDLDATQFLAYEALVEERMRIFGVEEDF